MASPQSSREYAEDAQEVIAALVEDGHLASFGTLATTEAHLPPGDYTEVGTANVLPIPDGARHFSDYSDDIRTTDQFFMVAPEVDLTQCTHKDSADFEILRTTESFSPDNITLIYTFVQVRCLV